MIFAIKDDQVDEYGRIEVDIRYFTVSRQSRKQLPVFGWREIMDLMIDEGFYPEFECSIPSWVEGVAYNRKNINSIVKPRIFKKWCKKLFNKYGEPERVLEIDEKFDEWLDSLDEENSSDFVY